MKTLTLAVTTALLTATPALAHAGEVGHVHSEALVAVLAFAALGAMALRLVVRSKA